MAEGSQNQLDIPPISVGRYLDLLKRRKWRVIPFSLLGLLIGAAIAFIIPRYHVSRTEVLYTGSATDIRANSREDPMASVVTAAVITVPTFVKPAIEKLGWEESRGSPFEVNAYVREVQGRLKVVDGRRTEGRVVAHLTILYSDEDAERARDLCNEVREIWMASEQAGIRQDADTNKRQINSDIAAAQNAYVNAVKDLRDFEQRYRINPEDLRVGTSVVMSELSRRIGGYQEEMRRYDEQEGALEAELKREEPKLDTVQKTREKNISDIADAATKAAAEVILKRIAGATVMLGQFPVGTRAHEEYRKQKESSEAELAELLGGSVGEGGTTLEPNPKWVEIRDRVDEMEKDLEVLRSRKQVLQGVLDAALADQQRRPEIYAQWSEKRQARIAAEEELSRLRQERSGLLERSRQAYNDNPIRLVSEAQLSPAPTDPDIVLVAIIGSLLGLGVAVGLILLLDFVQATFKTVADVEHGIALPVLGTMAHMECDQEKRATGRRIRLRVLVSAVALLFAITIVVVYWLDATRLPEPVRQILDLIMGKD